MIDETIDITYQVKGDLIKLLKDSTNHTEKDIWCNLSDIAQKCVLKIKNNPKSQYRSWTTKTYPGTVVKVRVDVDTNSMLKDKDQYEARIKMANNSKWVRFTHKQVLEYITEEILLGDE